MKQNRSKKMKTKTIDTMFNIKLVNISLNISLKLGSQSKKSNFIKIILIIGLIAI